MVTGPTVGGLGLHTALELAGAAPAWSSPAGPTSKLEESERTDPRRGAGRGAGQARRRPGRPRLGAARRRPRGLARPDRRTGQQRRGDGHAVPPDPRRPRAADGDQPLRPVPADRAAAPAAGRQRGRAGGHGVLADAPGGPEGAARRPAPASRGATPAGSPTARPSSPTCCSPTSSSGAAARPSCRSRRWPRIPGFAGTHLAANGQYGRSSGGIASILDAAVKAVSQSPAAGAWPTLMAATADLPGGPTADRAGCRRWPARRRW